MGHNGSKIHHLEHYEASPLLFEGSVVLAETNEEFYRRFCLWAESSGFAKPEYLLPQIIVQAQAAEPFTYERRVVAHGLMPPSQAQIDALGPWDYQIEWGNISTRGERRDLEWLVHRLRGSAFGTLSAALTNNDPSGWSIIDVACHCGVLSLEFAERGFGRVAGVDLRQNLVDQGNFLAESFGLSKNVKFTVANVRDAIIPSADIVLCGGLLYHVTFPVELMAKLFHATKRFLIFDTMLQQHPFSGFHIISDRNVNRTLDGDNQIEFMPTYRAVIDLLKGAGFHELYEVFTSCAAEVPLYKERHIRTFLAVKPGEHLPRFSASGT